MVTIEHRTGADADFPWPRLVDFVLGLWLFASAFLWPHTHSEMMTATIVGIVMVVTAAWSMFAHVVHYLNTLAAIWLFFSALGTNHATAGTAWNDALVAIVVFFLSLVPNTWSIHRKSAEM